MGRELIRNKYYILAATAIDFQDFCDKVGLDVYSGRVEWVTNTSQVLRIPSDSEIYKGHNYLRSSILRNYWFRTRILIGELKIVNWRG